MPLGSATTVASDVDEVITVPAAIASCATAFTHCVLSP